MTGAAAGAVAHFGVSESLPTRLRFRRGLRWPPASWLRLRYSACGACAAVGSTPGRPHLHSVPHWHVDSLSLAEVIASLEDRLELSIPEEDAATLNTVGDTVAYLERRLVGRSDPAGAIQD